MQLNSQGKTAAMRLSLSAFAIMQKRQNGEKNLKTTQYAILLSAFCLAHFALPGHCQPLKIKAAKPANPQELISMYPVSMIRILANPEAYKGKTVRVEGILHLNFEDSRLYLTKEHADHLSCENAIDVQLSNKRLSLEPAHSKKALFENYSAMPKSNYFNDKYVMLEGTFDKNLMLSVARILEVEYYKDYRQQ